jgi:Fic family protein
LIAKRIGSHPKRAMIDTPGRRDTRADDAQLVKDPHEIARAEARNVLVQAQAGEEMVLSAIERGGFKLRPSQILLLHGKALNGLSAYSGLFRPGAVRIGESGHVPPPAHLVPSLVEDLCDFVNERWEAETPLFLAAYVMWRLNWIHPFTDGNGRTSRMVSYVVLSIRAGYLPSGSPSIPAQIEKDRAPYFRALESADEAWSRSELDLEQMVSLLSSLLAKQLVAFFESVGGQVPL